MSVDVVQNIALAVQYRSTYNPPLKQTDFFTEEMPRGLGGWGGRSEIRQQKKEKSAKKMLTEWTP